MNSITEHFGADHDRLDGIFTEFQSLKRTDAAAAKQKFQLFLTGLTRHIVWEEDALFPLFEERTGMKNSGPTSVMRLEHREIKRHLDEIHDKVRAADPDSDALEAELLEVLKAHNMKEERYACCCGSH
jgi:iron-sulfur cluster repair protein YtfE (RIC family)